MLAVALLAGFLFIGGGAAIYLSQPQQPPATAVANQPSAGRSLDVFVQETPTPLPTPEPTLVPLPTIDPFATPTIDPFASPTPDPFATPTPIVPPPTPTPTPTSAPAATEARFSWGQRDGTLRIIFSNNSIGATSWSWDFGDGSSSTEAEPRHVYPAPGQYRVVLNASGPNGTDTRARNVTVAPTATPAPPFDVSCTWSGQGPYVANCTASGAEGPYTWFGTKNPNISPDGNQATFTWETPPGRVRITVTAQNGSEARASHTFPSPTPSPSPSNDPGTPLPTASPDGPNG